MLVTSLLRKFL
uniref:Uncharacterized protein n=1 Tax=Arundo donax TaxID=35708 RepID=A0A0A9AQ43_ARUDO